MDLILEPNHYEINLIIGKKANGYSNLLTSTERISKKTFIKSIRTKNCHLVKKAIAELIQGNNLTVKTIAIDNGFEFNKIGLFAKRLNFLVYFCEPYDSYQRVSNEHANGLVRRFYKNGFDFSDLIPKDIEDLQDKINSMPREVFNWKCSKYIWFNFKNVKEKLKNKIKPLVYGYEKA
ncbi:IS30 family transposase [Candidatus Mycoplasma pogonae]